MGLLNLPRVSPLSFDTYVPTYQLQHTSFLMAFWPWVRVGSSNLPHTFHYNQHILIRKILHTSLSIGPLQWPFGQGSHLTIMEDLWRAG